MEIIRGELPTKQRKTVLGWTKEQREFLLEKWNEFNPTN